MLRTYLIIPLNLRDGEPHLNYVTATNKMEAVRNYIEHFKPTETGMLIVSEVHDTTRFMITKPSSDWAIREDTR